MPHTKDIFLKLYLPNIITICDSGENPALLGSVMLALVALKHSDYDTLYKLFPNGSPLPNYMLAKGLITVDNKFEYQMTEKGNVFITYFLAKPPKAKVKKEDPPEIKEVETWLKDWCEKWPASVTSAGKLVRCTPKACMEKMKWFVREYGYIKGVRETGFTKDEIFIATVNGYLMTKYKAQWQYTMLAHNFIRKNEGKNQLSELSSWCQRLRTPQDNSGFQSKEVSVKRL
jgi:hypothetical protein